MRIWLRPFAWNLLLLAAAFILSVAIGAVTIPPLTLIRLFWAQLPGVTLSADWPAAFSQIVFAIRLPHAVLVMLVGAALAGSGAAFQGLFRNPLADPYLIGAAGGAGLGAVLAMTVWSGTLVGLGLYRVPVLAFGGALGTVLLVYRLAQFGGTSPTTGLILAGVAVSSFATALTSFLILRADNEIHGALAWMFGGSLLAGWEPVRAALPFLIVGMGGLLLAGHTLNVLQFGDEQAQQMGLAVGTRRRAVILAASLTTAAAVAFAGLIGFVGLIVPHVMRMLSGPDYRRLLPLSMLGGASALLLADLLARVVMAPQVLPIGIVTALAGAPFFLWILRRSAPSEE
jgi:iron complex transport system permease protein